MITILAILAAILLAFLAFKFVSGIIKFGVLAVIALVCIFVAHQAGAF